MKTENYNATALLATTLLLANFAPRANTADLYIGDAAAEGLAVTNGGGPRADTVNTLTYLLHTGSPSVYTAPSDQQLTLTEVNFFADASGILTPFVARYLGGDTQAASSYVILAKGEPLQVTSSDNTLGPSAGDHLENRAFTVDSLNPTIDVDAGDMIVSGWLQVGNVVYIGGGSQGVADYISNGDALTGAAVGAPPTLNSNWAFDRPMQLNIGFDIADGNPFRITAIDYDPDADTFRFTWTSKPGRSYVLRWSLDLTNWDSDVDDGIASQGDTTTYPAPGQPAVANPATTNEGRPNKIFFRVEEQGQ